MHKRIFNWACIFGILAVGFGAFGTHYFKSKVTPDIFSTFQTGVQFHFYHVFAMLSCGLLFRSYRHDYFALAALLFGLGIVMFSGSLYLHTWSSLNVDDFKINFARITPIGGVFFILGWIVMSLFFLRFSGKESSKSGKGVS